jgi:hypothetical protein
LNRCVLLETFYNTNKLSYVFNNENGFSRPGTRSKYVLKESPEESPLQRIFLQFTFGYSFLTVLRNDIYESQIIRNCYAREKELLN